MSNGKELQKHIDTLRLRLSQELGEATVALLMQKTPKKEIKTRLLNPQKAEGSGNPRFRYVEHAWITKTLNFAFAFNWDLVIEETKEYNDQVVVRGYLEVRTNKATIKKWGVGGAKIHPGSPNEKRADVFKSAQSDMLKRCAMLLGLGLDLYRKEDSTAQEAEEARVEANKVESPKPEPVKEASASVEVKPATPAQIGMIKDIAKAKKLEVETEGLSRDQASAKIQELIKEKNNGKK